MDGQGAARECIVCGNTDGFSPFLSQTDRHPAYVRCRTCGLVFEHPQIPCDVNSAAYFFRHATEFSLATRFANFDCRFDHIARHTKAKKPRVLDVGTNDGVFLKYLASKGIEAVGIELNQKAVESGQRAYGVDIRDVPLEAIEDREAFDVVTFFNVLEHFDDPVAALAKVRKVTTSDATLALELPNIFTLQAKVFGGRWHHFQPTHRWFFNHATIAAFLRRHGFEVVHTSLVPKIVTLTRPVWLLGWVLGVFKILKRCHVDITADGRMFKFFDQRRVRINIGDYLFVVARKVSA